MTDNDIFTIQDVVKATKTSRHTIYAHVNKNKIGTIVSGVFWFSRIQFEKLVGKYGPKREENN